MITNHDEASEQMPPTELERQPASRPTTDVAIVGGGIIGLSLAWELSRRGKSVTIVESGKTGRASSWAGAGILPPVPKKNSSDPYESFRSFSHGLHFEWAEVLRHTTGIDTGFRACGGIYLASTTAEMATLVANQAWWNDHGIAYEVLSTGRLQSLEPAFSGARERSVFLKDDRAAWLLPEECQLRNPRHLQALRSACENNGVRIVENKTISGFEESKDSGDLSAARSESGERWTAKQFCVCSGPWSRKLMLDLGLANGIMPIRGRWCSTRL